jgi:hypothetical protein
VRVLFDQGTSVPLRKHLTQHDVFTAFELGWSSLENGQLLVQAESEVFVTTDQNLKYQQNLSARSIGIVVLGSTSWPRIQKAVAAVVDAIENTGPTGYIEVTVPFGR